MEFILLCIIVGWLWDKLGLQKEQQAAWKKWQAEHPGYEDVLMG